MAGTFLLKYIITHNNLVTVSVVYCSDIRIPITNSAGSYLIGIIMIL